MLLHITIVTLALDFSNLGITAILTLFLHELRIFDYNINKSQKMWCVTQWREVLYIDRFLD